MTIADRVFNLMTRTGKGYTNDELAVKVQTTRDSVRGIISGLRAEGVPIVKKARYDKATGKMLPAKYFIPVSQDHVIQTEVPRGRPSRSYAVPA